MKKFRFSAEIFANSIGEAMQEMNSWMWDNQASDMNIEEVKLSAWEELALDIELIDEESNGA
jgi:hypothetical protein